MAVSPTMVIAGRVAVRSGRKYAHSRMLGAVVAAGLQCGVACGAADTVSDVTTHCEPKLCLAPDKPDGPPDGEKLCPTGVCNYQTQVGCPQTQTCAVHLDPTTGDIYPKCIPVGTVKAGEPCDTTSTPTMPATPDKLCAKGLQCIGETGKGQICRKLCCGGAPYGDWRACDPGESCIRQIKPVIEQPLGSGTLIELDAHVSFCVPVNTCDVLDSESCKGDGGDPARPVCRIVDPLGRVACRPPQPKNSQIGSQCDHADQCGPVQHCQNRTDRTGVPLQETPHCVRLCRLEYACGADGCQGEGTCVHFERDPLGVGECTPNFDEDQYCKPDASLPMTRSPAPTDGGRG